MSGGLQTPDTDKKFASYPDASQRMQNRAFLNRWIMGTKATAPGLVIGTGSAAKVKNTNAVDFILAGVPQTQLAAAQEAALAGTDLAASERCKFLIYVQGGALKALQGPIVASTETPELPGLPADAVCVGDCQVETDNAHTFTPGTTLLSAAGITDTYRDLIWPDSGPAKLDTAGSAGTQ